MNQIKIPYPREFLRQQDAVLNAFNNLDKKYVLYSGAFGAGKTLLECHVVIQDCLRFPKSLWFFGAQTIPNLRDTVVRTFKQEIDLYQECINKAREKLPDDQKHLLDFKLEKKYLTQSMNFIFYNGSEVLFRSCDEPSKFKSLNLDGFAIDEPVDIDEEVFLMLQGRLRGLNGRRIGVLAGNPSGRTNWVYQKFIEHPSTGYYTIHTTTYDNTFLTSDYIKNMEESYDEDYKRRYLYGHWGSFEGQIYKHFNPRKHIGKFKDKECKYHICGCDDGTRNPACFLVIGIDSDNNLYVKEEVYKSGLVDSEKVREIHDLHLDYNFQRIYVDPSALSLKEAIRNMGMVVVDGDNDIVNGISKMKSLFKNNYIYMDENCKNLIREIEGYRYDRGGKHNKNDPERPIMKNDHSCDALRYGVTDFNPWRVDVGVGTGHW